MRIPRITLPGRVSTYGDLAKPPPAPLSPNRPRVLVTRPETERVIFPSQTQYGTVEANFEIDSFTVRNTAMTAAPNPSGIHVHLSFGRLHIPQLINGAFDEDVSSASTIQNDWPAPSSRRLHWYMTAAPASGILIIQLWPVGVTPGTFTE